MKLAVYDQKGKKSTKTAEVQDSVFAAKRNDALLAQYVYVYLSNQRASIAHAKDRSAVSGGGKKPWRQKGTGRARHGSSRSPIWSGGGVTFGPSSARNWTKKITKNMKRRALATALSRLAAEDKVKVIDSIEMKDGALTKQGVELLEAFGSPRKLTIVTGTKNDKLINAFSNISNVNVMLVSELNAYTAANAGEMLITQDALEYTNHWA